MGKSINETLINLFSKYRIVFWYDNKYEMLEEFQELKLESVEKIKINNNEFSIKYEVLKNKPNQKFLIYTNKSENNKQDNWLLDIQLYSGIYNSYKLWPFGMLRSLFPLNFSILKPDLFARSDRPEARFARFGC